MEDAATAEISRAQLWQWVHNRVTLQDGRALNKELYQHFAGEEYEKVRHELSTLTRDLKRVKQAREILDDLVLDEKFENFLTIKAYEFLG
jgi:malate synthase